MRAALILCALLLSVPAAPGLSAERVAPDRLWVQAVTLMQQGRPAQALPLLDRLVSIDPDNTLYRLELGYALFQTRRYGRARFHLDRARAGNRDRMQLAAANRLIAETDARKMFSGYLSFSIRPETNPGKQTGLSSIDILGLPFTVNRAPATTTLILATGLSARPHLSDRARLGFGVDTWSRFSEVKALRDHQLTLHAGPILSFAQGGQIEIGGLVRRRWTAGKHKSDSHGGYARLGLQLGQQTYLTLNASREHSRHFDGSVPEDRTRLIAQLNHLATPALLLRGTLGVTLTDTPLPAASGRMIELRLGGTRSFRNGIDLRTDLWHRTDNRRGPDRLFGITRKDRILGLELGLSNRDLRVGPFVPELIVGAEQGRSSIGFYDYDNSYVNVGLRTRF